MGRMDTTLTAVAVAEDGIVTAYLKEADAASVRAENNVTVAGGHAKVKSVETQPMRVDDSFTDYMRHVGGLQAGEWVYAAQLEADLPDGVYAAKIVIDSVSPMSFVLN